MKRRNYKGREPLPLAVSDAAQTGDADAVEQVLRYYEGYINKLCTRTVYDESGCPHACLDEYSPCLLGRVHEKPSGKQTDPRHSRRELITGPGWGEQLTLSLFLPPAGLGISKKGW